MAASSPASFSEEGQEHEVVDREATELGTYDQVLHTGSAHDNNSAQMPDACNARANGANLPTRRRSLAKFWQRQVSATVPHEACRDHFGTLSFPFRQASGSLPRILWH